jgi:hypothetical protein
VPAQVRHFPYANRLPQPHDAIPFSVRKIRPQTGQVIDSAPRAFRPGGRIGEVVDNVMT